ncbi:hypothetical protein HG536_0A00880 [Torulaspora globosa]|uniref:Ubiquitin-like modifier-activating enzyme ATG7 n=1 Tax=Torulaspora globosa TaxID=48254 RepID=A0A7G3Z9T5_9SACH|nr:uncharacterized protein HG536_0A00880 [Torulaspora globosa]QLL30271.1 hypothetical protein HG536_0A00880 [Torulaspora globosa]
MSDATLKYGSPLQSFLDASFFQELCRLKLDVLKLDSRGQPLFACLDTSYTFKSRNSVPLSLNERTFQRESLRTSSGVRIYGVLHNFNRFEEFKSLDKQEFVKRRATEVYHAGLININDSVSFHVISFADLKEYRFYYWVCVPCFQKKTLSIKVLETRPLKVAERYQKWFEERVGDWVALLSDQNELIPYNRQDAGTCKALIVRDTCRLDNIPSALTKNFLTIFNHDSPDRDTLEVLFIRPADSSFVLTLSLHDLQTGGNEHLQFSGWERNTQNKLGPRGVDLSSLIDPLKIADQTVDLNLKLMKWRLVPELDLEKVKGAKALLLGSGTLGCYVARALMAWGVRKITFVDNGNVSSSNPVRQPLFEFHDIGKNKALAAAEAVKKVFPLLDAEGVELSVPMIGHPVTNEEVEHASYERLCDLFDEHDVVFLLMDSRETRWLPTVMGNAKGKIVINAALGFDSYLVMRHGNYSGVQGPRLGCYFCHDVFAPKDSMKDRTLDEMCTVTRPGVALMAASQAVELFVSLLQPRTGGDNEETILGELPHQIRGFLNNFSTLKLRTPAYDHCSACCPSVVDSYKSLDWDFVRSALNDHTYIEELSGLAKVQLEAERASEQWKIDDVEIDDEMYALN